MNSIELCQYDKLHFKYHDKNANELINNILKNYDIYKHIQNTCLLGQGVSGKVYYAQMNVKTGNYPIVIKAGKILHKKLNKYDEQLQMFLYEKLISAKLNELRKFIPNFLYTYNAFICMDKSNDLKTLEYKRDEHPTFCLSNNLNTGTFYFISEYIKGNIIHKYILSNINKPNICQIITNFLLQGTLALYTAWDKFGFRHFDMHQENAIILDYKMNNNVEYVVGNKKYILFIEEPFIIFDFNLSVMTKLEINDENLKKYYQDRLSLESDVTNEETTCKEFINSFIKTLLMANMYTKHDSDISNDHINKFINKMSTILSGIDDITNFDALYNLLTNTNKSGGYYNKYLKYKHKYLQLKNEKNKFVK